MQARSRVSRFLVAFFVKVRVFSQRATPCIQSIMVNSGAGACWAAPGGEDDHIVIISLSGENLSSQQRQLLKVPRVSFLTKIMLQVLHLL